MEIAQTADYALRVLLELERQDGQSINALAELLGVSRSATQRILTTLRDRALVLRDHGGKYFLGPGLIALGQHIAHDLTIAAGPLLRELSDSTGETIVLSAPMGDVAEVVASSLGTSGPLRIDYQTGFRHPLTTGASGLAILAFSDPVGGRSSLVPEVAEQLDLIRQRGYAETSGEIRPDMAGLAVPVFAGDDLLGSLALIAPAGRYAGADCYLDRLHAAAHHIGGSFHTEQPQRDHEETRA
jgi:IclR family transcriptional regulator, KDG regulon repressor